MLWIGSQTYRAEWSGFRYFCRVGIRIDGSTGENVVTCTSCGELIFDDLRVLRNHDIENLPDGRTKLIARDFGMTVHLCSPDQLEAMAERVVLEATSLLL